MNAETFIIRKIFEIKALKNQDFSKAVLLYKAQQ